MTSLIHSQSVKKALRGEKQDEEKPNNGVFVISHKGSSYKYWHTLQHHDTKTHYITTGENEHGSFTVTTPINAKSKDESIIEYHTPKAILKEDSGTLPNGHEYSISYKGLGKWLLRFWKKGSDSPIEKEYDSKHAARTGMDLIFKNIEENTEIKNLREYNYMPKIKTPKVTNLYEAYAKVYAKDKLGMDLNERFITESPRDLPFSPKATELLVKHGWRTGVPGGFKYAFEHKDKSKYPGLFIKDSHDRDGMWQHTVYGPQHPPTGKIIAWGITDKELEDHLNELHKNKIVSEGVFNAPLTRLERAREEHMRRVAAIESEAKRDGTHRKTVHNEHDPDHFISHIFYNDDSMPFEIKTLKPTSGRNNPNPVYESLQEKKKF